MSTYADPLFYSPTALIALKPGVDNLLGAQISKVLAPFEPSVWLMIVLIIILTTLLLMWFLGKSKARMRNVRRLTGRRWCGYYPKQLDCTIWG